VVGFFALIFSSSPEAMVLTNGVFS